MRDSLVAALALVLQTIIVFGGNSRWFGLIKPGHGWYTNIEMAERYASLLTPAGYAFAIWGVIYTWEFVAMAYLALGPKTFGWSLKLWLAANFFQSLWAPLFATERIALSALALSGIAISLILLAWSMRGASGSEYWLLVAPVWLHAGWTTAASLVNVNLVVSASTTSPSTQLACAFASGFLALFVGMAVSFFATAPPSALPYSPWPLAAALCWAVAAVRSELLHPRFVKNLKAYAEIGQYGREALELANLGIVLTLAVSALAIYVGRWATNVGWLPTSAASASKSLLGA